MLAFALVVRGSFALVVVVCAWGLPTIGCLYGLFALGLLGFGCNKGLFAPRLLWFGCNKGLFACVFPIL